MSPMMVFLTAYIVSAIIANKYLEYHFIKIFKLKKIPRYQQVKNYHYNVFSELVSYSFWPVIFPIEAIGLYLCQNNKDLRNTIRNTLVVSLVSEYGYSDPEEILLPEDK